VVEEGSLTQVAVGGIGLALATGDRAGEREALPYGPEARSPGRRM